MHTLEARSYYDLYALHIHSPSPVIIKPHGSLLSVSVDLESRFPRTFVCESDSTARDPKMSYDDILSHVGEFGSYQMMVFILAWWAAMLHAFNMVNFVFLYEDVDFRCAVPGLENDTFDIQSEAHLRLVNSSMPYDAKQHQYSQCRVFAGSSFHGYQRNRTVSCERWVYDHAKAPNSMIPEFDLVCDRKMFRTHLGMLIMVGLLVGSFCGGTLSDFMGRKRVMMVMFTILLFFHTSLAFVNTILWVMIMKCIAAAIGLAQFLAFFVLVAELVGPSKRGYAALGTMLSWSTSMSLAALLYLWTTNWRTAQLLATLPFAIFLVCWWLVDESPRWLMIQNKPKEAMKVIRKIAKRNRVTLKKDFNKMAVLGSAFDQQQSKQEKIWMILADKGMMVRLVILGLNWGIINLCYYSFTLNVGDIVKGSTHLNVFIQSIMEYASIAVCLVCSSRIGRKPLYCGCICFGGAACLATSLLPLASAENEWASLVLFSLGRFGVGGAFASIYIATAEMLPTTSRNFGLGLCSVSGRVFGVITPYIADLGLLIPGKFGESFPLMFIGVGSILCGLSVYWLPETHQRTLPDTIADANNIRTKLDMDDKKPEEQEMISKA